MSNITTLPTNSTALALSEKELIDVLQSSLYPGAAPNSIKLVIGYCKAANLDPMQKPVHIVPMWDKNAKAMRDVIMPGVGLYRTQAARSRELVGIGEPEFGPNVEYKLGGTTYTVPEWCRVVVKRVVANGVIGEFAAVEYWIENYATAGKDSDAPNAMWKKRTRGQLAKCAEAQALRKAFPEMVGSAPTADEMEGKTLDAAEIDITPVKTESHADTDAMIAEAQKTTTDEAALKYWKDNNAKLAKHPAEHERLKQAIAEHRVALKEREANRTIDMPTAAAPAPVDEFVAAMDAAAPEYVPE